MLKALLFTNLYPSTREPTRGTFNLHGFRAMLPHCDMRLVVPVPWWNRLRTPREWLIPPADASTGVDAVYPTYWPVPALPLTHVWAMNHTFRPYVRRLRETFPFDVVLVAMACPEGVCAARMAQDAGTPLVTMVLGSDVNDLAQRPSLRKPVGWGLRRSARVVTVSRALKERVVELGVPGERVVVQHNGVDGERFRIRDRDAARRRLGLDLDAPLVLFAGNLVGVKGVDLLVEAADHVRRSGDAGTRFAVVGSGVQEGRVRARVAELGLEERVLFPGRRPHDEIPDWMAACDVFCLPSRREGCPNVVLEALASGRPVVATAVGGVPEILSAACGRVVRPEDPAAIARGLREVLDANWDAERLRASVPCLSWSDFGRCLAGILEEAVQDHRRQRCRTSAEAYAAV